MEARDGPQNNAVEIRMAATPAWIPVARSVAERLAGRANFDGDAICDLRLAVDEACTAVANQSAEGAILTCAFGVQPGRIDFEVSGAAANEAAPFGTLSWRILRAVTDELVLRHHPGHRFTIRMAKHM